jgi:hypothetical protein
MATAVSLEIPIERSMGAAVVGGLVFSGVSPRERVRDKSDSLGRRRPSRIPDTVGETTRLPPKQHMII